MTDPKAGEPQPEEIAEAIEVAAAWPNMPKYMQQAPEGWVRMIAREEIEKAIDTKGRDALALNVTRLALEQNLRDARGLQTIVEECRAIIRAYRRSLQPAEPVAVLSAPDVIEQIAKALRG